MTARALTAESARIVREIHRAGAISAVDLLPALSLLGVSRLQLTRRLGHHCELGWIENVGGPTYSARWGLTPEALALMPHPGALPIRPGDGPVVDAKPAAPRRPQAARRELAPAQPARIDCMRAPVLRSTPWAPARPGADDHKQHASHGLRC